MWNRSNGEEGITSRGLPENGFIAVVGLCTGSVSLEDILKLTPMLLRGNDEDDSVSPWCH